MEVNRLGNQLLLNRPTKANNSPSITYCKSNLRELPADTVSFGKGFNDETPSIKNNIKNFLNKNFSQKNTPSESDLSLNSFIDSVTSDILPKTQKADMTFEKATHLDFTEAKNITAKKELSSGIAVIADGIFGHDNVYLHDADIKRTLFAKGDIVAGGHVLAEGIVGRKNVFLHSAETTKNITARDLLESDSNLVAENLEAKDINIHNADIAKSIVAKQINSDGNILTENTSSDSAIFRNVGVNETLKTKKGLYVEGKLDAKIVKAGADVNLNMVDADTIITKGNFGAKNIFELNTLAILDNPDAANNEERLISLNTQRMPKNNKVKVILGEKIKKLVVETETGDLGIFNNLDFYKGTIKNSIKKVGKQLERVYEPQITKHFTDKEVMDLIHKGFIRLAKKGEMITRL